MSTNQPEKTTADRLDAAMLAAIAEIEAQIDIVANRRAQLVEGGFDKDLASAAAALSRALSSVNAEHRAGIKARAWTAKNLPSELVMEHLRQLPAERRGHIVNELIRLDDESSVLG